jgi:hypothetical protein
MSKLLLGLICDQGIQATQKPKNRKAKSKGTHLESPRQVQEDALSSDHLQYSKQPFHSEGFKSMQGISDTLFDVSETSYDYSERRKHQARKAKSGNPLLTVVHQTGVFDMEVLFCICPNAGPDDEQLLQWGLFPSSFKQIETVFTFSVLDEFLTDNLECKTTAQQYYSKLQSITNQMFPDNVPVCHPTMPITLC